MMEEQKNSNHALMASGKKGGKGKQKKKKDGTKEKTDKLEIICYNCHKLGHKQFECWAKGGGKEGQGPRQKKSAKAQEAIVVAIADNDKDELFTFTCTSNYANVAENLQVLKSKHQQKGAPLKWTCGS